MYACAGVAFLIEVQVFAGKHFHPSSNAGSRSICFRVTWECIKNKDLQAPFQIDSGSAGVGPGNLEFDMCFSELVQSRV